MRIDYATKKKKKMKLIKINQAKPCPYETYNGSANPPPNPWTHMVPFAIDLLRRDGCVGVGAGHVDVVGLDNLGHLVVDAQNGQALLVGIREGGLELLMGRSQSLDRDRDSGEAQ